MRQFWCLYLSARIYSIKFFAGRATSHAGVVNYSKWLATLYLRKNLLTRRVSVLVSNEKHTAFFTVLKFGK
jgi:hypothetical protein